MPAHELSTGDGPVHIDSDADDPPAPLLEDTDYWAIVIDPDTLQLAETYADTGRGGTPIVPVDFQDAGSGALTLKSTDDTLKAGEELLAVARTLLRVSVELSCRIMLHMARGQSRPSWFARRRRRKLAERLTAVRWLLTTASMLLHSQRDEAKRPIGVLPS